ncbi:hypothetical protein [Mesorhizobium loti]|uniref:hypothetical protein n=1 Tax=Rhizobium loti TaxID=381 RepID=UPI0007EDB8FF|nr:hypothetical protein [Mesorhizobium loti]
MYMGLRLSDLAIVGRQHVKDGWLSIRPKKTEKKTGVVVELPILAPLAEVIEHSPTGDMTYLVSEWGTPFTLTALGTRCVSGATGRFARMQLSWTAEGRCGDSR